MSRSDERSPSLTEKVIEAILLLIKTKKLTEGEKVGSERDLSEQLNVSRWHIRKALSALESDGVILRTYGRSGGVFVAPQKLVREAQPIVSVVEFLRTYGIEAGTTVLESKLLPSSLEISTALNLEPREWVLKIKRLRVAKGIPLNLETNIFPLRLFPELQNEDLSGSLYELLEAKYDLRRGEAQEEISSRGASAAESRFLQVVQNSPVLVLDRTAHTETGEIFEYSREVYRSDRISIRVNTRAQPSDIPRVSATVELVEELAGPRE